MTAHFISIASPDGALKVDFCPSVGGCLTAFYAERGGKRVDLFRPYDPALPLSPLNFASFPLTPFSNRIGYGKLAFRGEVFDVGPPFGGEPHPNHGDGWTSAWAVKEHSAHKIVMTLKTKNTVHTPYVYEAEEVFMLENDALVADISVKNLSGRALPFGTGHHPYFVRTDQTIVQARLPKMWNSRNMVPTELVPVPEKWNFARGVTLAPVNLESAAHGGDGTAYIDHCFTGWDQYAEIIWPEYKTKLVMKADPVFKNFVIYVPSKQNFFCAEPVTNATDGFNLMDKGVTDTGTVVLDDRQTLSGRVRFEVHAA